MLGSFPARFRQSVAQELPELAIAQRPPCAAAEGELVQPEEGFLDRAPRDGIAFPATRPDAGLEAPGLG
jgi:hypothetical protein